MPQFSLSAAARNSHSESDNKMNYDWAESSEPDIDTNGNEISLLPCELELRHQMFEERRRKHYKMKEGLQRGRILTESEADSGSD